MTLTTQNIDNSTISAFGAQVPKSVVFAIHDASQKSGADFSYLVKQAAVESSFDPNAKAKGSSATGLYQFIQSTWLDMVDKYGEKYGLDTSSMSRKDLMALRKDPEVSSCMAAELSQENGEFLNNNWGGEVGETELYLAHFMGAGGAASFLKAKDNNPMMAAADLFPDAARSNRSVFFDGNGRARSVSEVYNLFDKKFHDFEPEAQQMAAAMTPETAAPAAQKPAPQAVASTEPPPIILPAHSVVFSMRPNYGAYGTNQTQDEKMAAVSSYRQMMANPVELMMLSQLDPSPEKKNTGFF
jgi:hypothetical protein